MARQADTDNGIAAVVVAHQSESTLAACLARLRAAEGITQIRVIDNGSSDATLEIMQRHASQDARIRFIANPDNPGFAVACNQGAADSDAPWLALVNPDCMVDTQTLSRLLAHARAYAGEALLGTDLVDEHGRHDPAARRRAPQFARMLWSKAARDLSVPADPAQVLQPVEALSGALLLTSRQLFARLGGFDPDYRLHAEDLDLCRRARDAGSAVLIANDICVLHLRGVSSRARPLFVEWHKHRGLWRYFCKFEAAHTGKLASVLVWLAIWLHLPLAVMQKKRVNAQH